MRSESSSSVTAIGVRWKLTDLDIPPYPYGLPGVVRPSTTPFSFSLVNVVESSGEDVDEEGESAVGGRDCRERRNRPCIFAAAVRGVNAFATGESASKMAGAVAFVFIPYRDIEGTAFAWGTSAAAGRVCVSACVNEPVWALDLDC